MSKLSKLAKDLRRSSRLTTRQALMLKGGDVKRMGPGAGRGIAGPGTSNGNAYEHDKGSDLG